MTVEIKVTDISAEFSKFWTVVKYGTDASALGAMSMAATKTMREAATIFKTQGRAAIRGGGLGAKFANAWRVNVYPAKGFALDPAVFGYHKIPYSLIFQEGGVIRAKRGLLWLPLPTVPKVGKRIARPRDLTGVKLYSVNNGSGKPLLVAKIRNAGANRGSRIRGVVSLPALRAGTNAEKIRTTSRLKAKQRGGVKGSNAGARIVTVPLFIGVSSVRLRSRFNLEAVSKSVVLQLPALYDQKVTGN